jgi:hypothetical protein
LHTNKRGKIIKENNKNTQKIAAFLYFPSSAAVQQGYKAHIACKI